MLKSLVLLAVILGMAPMPSKAQTSVRNAGTSSLLGGLAAVDSSDSEYARRDSIIAELVRRGPVDELIAAYGRTANNAEKRDLVVSVLYQLRGGRVTTFMRSLLSDSADFATYYRAMYFGKTGDTTALSLLNRHFWNCPVSSVQLSSTARLFGRFKYRPSIDNLITALQAASLNLARGSLVALKELYPDSPQFSDVAGAVKYYRRVRHSKGTAP